MQGQPVKINHKKSFRSSKVSAAEFADQAHSQKLNRSEYRRQERVFQEQLDLTT